MRAVPPNDPGHTYPGLARLDPRTKILLALGFIITLGILPAGEYLSYGILLLILFSFTYLSGYKPLYLVKRSVIALPFALAAATLLFTIPGETILTMPIMGLDISREGAIRFSSVVVKSWISVQAAILLLTMTSFPDLLWGLQKLHTPHILVAVAGFSYRYIGVVWNEANRLRRARAARSASTSGLRSGGSIIWRSRVTGWMIGSLLLRSLERSERIYNAMLARGYRGEILTLKRFELTSGDAIALSTAMALYVSILLISILFIAPGFD